MVGEVVSLKALKLVPNMWNVSPPIWNELWNVKKVIYYFEGVIALEIT